VAQDNLTYYDRVLEVNRTRQQAGDISEVDLGRLELQRVQYESDLQNADVSLRTAKIQLLSLLNDRTPIEKFDVNGSFGFNEQITPLEEFRATALDTRPDLRAALQAIDKAKTDHQLAIANGSADPTFAVWWTHNPSFNNPFDYNTIGASVSIPFRINDRNQGEKLRHAARHHTQRIASRRQSRASIQRRRLGLRNNRKQHRAAAPLQRKIFAASREGTGHDFLRVSKRRRVAAGFLERAKRLPQYSTELSEPGGLLHDRRRPNDLAVGKEVIP